VTSRIRIDPGKNPHTDLPVTGFVALDRLIAFPETDQTKYCIPAAAGGFALDTPRGLWLDRFLEVSHG